MEFSIAFLAGLALGVLAHFIEKRSSGGGYRPQTETANRKPPQGGSGTAPPQRQMTNVEVSHFLNIKVGTLEIDMNPVGCYGQVLLDGKPTPIRGGTITLKVNELAQVLLDISLVERKPWEEAVPRCKRINEE